MTLDFKKFWEKEKRAQPAQKPKEPLPPKLIAGAEAGDPSPNLWVNSIAPDALSNPSDKNALKESSATRLPGPPRENDDLLPPDHPVDRIFRK